MHDWKHNIKFYLKKKKRMMLTQLIWGNVVNTAMTVHAKTKIINTILAYLHNL